MLNSRQLTLLHQRAMRLAHAAESASDPETRDDLARKAFEAERRAAELLFGAAGEEPSRSVLYRSAAVLAFDCGDIREAERLAKEGLNGNPPDDIARELREVLERATHQLETARDLRESLAGHQLEKTRPAEGQFASWNPAATLAVPAMTKHDTSIFAFNGINGATGEPLYHSASLAEMDALARDVSLGHFGPQQAAEVAYRQQQRRSQFLLHNGFNSRDLASSGWGVVFSQHADPEIRDAIAPLIEHRRRQAVALAEHRFRELDYQPIESKRAFLRRFGVASSSPADPDRLPYHLLLVGSPEEIPWSFQHQLAIQYSVGRLFFDTAEEYAHYAETVIAAETGKLAVRPRRLVLFGTRHDQTTELMADHLIAPLHTALSSSSLFPVETILDDKATKERLARLLGGDETPSLLFTASHGLGFPAGDPQQLGCQGALLCQNWSRDPGPIGPDAYLAGDDVAATARPAGLVAFFYACHGLGTPQYDIDQAHGGTAASRYLAQQSFVAHLPRRLLGHPTGGALAVIGQVERTWGYSSRWQSVGSQTQVFEDCLKRLLDGYPVGSALEPFSLRLGQMATELTTLLESGECAEPEEAKELVSLWTAHNDARAYALLGDPAVRLPIPSQYRQQPTHHHRTHM